MIAPSVSAAILLLSVSALSQTTTTVEIDGIPIQVGPMGDSEDAVRWKVLADRNGIDSKQKLNDAASKNLTKAKKLPYQLQRVEITGVASIDDTNATLPGMFDMQVKTSHLNEVFPSGNRILDALKSIAAVVGRDFPEAASDTQGIPSPRSQEIISQLKDQRINELFAHSWGTEVVYLGLLNGTIIPPKKLFILGVPEDFEDKWRQLAAYTGIEVHVVGFEWDKLQIAGQVGRKIPHSGLPQDSAGLINLWREKCAAREGRGCVDPHKFVPTKFDYNVHVRPPNVPGHKFLDGHLSKLDHERMLYYTYLERRKLFNKTIEQLGAPQIKLIKDEENRILEEAMVEARSLIASAKSHAGIRASARSSGFWQSDDPEKLQKRLAELKQLGQDSAVRETPRIDVAHAPGVPVLAFRVMLPKVKDFAAASCQTPGKVPLIDAFTQPYENILFMGSDDQEADRLASGLGHCERNLFRRLIEVIRQGQGRRITHQWIYDTAWSYKTPEAANNNQTTALSPEPPPKRDQCGTDPNGVHWCLK